ncbi:hypothetical protein A9Q99_23755 [Gammaproteobacteria bacterium 45_16_T64]|nr:hypothetical protein A9Q99_23755 [Gammaproteobacteria bacterium 45_16_T64]
MNQFRLCEYESMKIRIITLIVTLICCIPPVQAECKGERYENYVSSFQFSPSKHICGKELKRFTILLKNNTSKTTPSFNGAEIFIRDKEGSMVTRQKLRSLGLNHNDKIYACISEEYIDNSYVKLYYREDKQFASYSNGASTRILRSSPIIDTCDLNDLIGSI